jgi:hypothetical protein
MHYNAGGDSGHGLTEYGDGVTAFDTETSPNFSIVTDGY